jgi:hypothetical protein
VKEVIKYVAFDGREFETAAACKTHEADNAETFLIGLKAEDIASAIAGTNPDVANAIERVGRTIAQARLARGERHRKPKSNGAPTDADPLQPDTPIGQETTS